jgi:hypothetical protein
MAHLRENLAAEGVTLDDEALRQLDALHHGQTIRLERYEAMTTALDSLRGRIAVVTGGAGAIGTAITKALQEAGDRTVVLDRDADIACDLGSEASTRAAAAAVLERYGRCDVFVHCAAAFDQVTNQ